MCDPIDRQTAIDLVKDVCDAIMSGCESWYDPETEDEVYKDIREVDAILKCNKEVRIALRNMPSVQPAQRWISVSERLPERTGYYLVTGKKQSVYITGYSNGRWYGGAKPIAWMPLPEPYKEGAEDDV